MQKYANRATVMINGTMVEHMKNFKRQEEEYREEVELMNGVGVVDKPTKFKFSIDYVTPKVGAKEDWQSIEGATVIVGRDGASRITYAGVCCLSRGEETYDGQGEAVTTITFMAETRNIG